MTENTSLISQPPIFVLSPPRSGSTLVRYILDTHPAICCPAEIALGEVFNTLYTAIYYTKGQLLKSSADSERGNVTLSEVRRIVSDFMGSYAQAKGKSIWCDKSPHNLGHLNLIDLVYPDARYICLYRNCLDTISSWIEYNRLGFVGELAECLRRNPGNIVAAMVEGWIIKVKREMRFERDHGSRCFRLKYETLVADPPAVLEELFKFLKVEWDPRIVDSVFAVEHDEGPGDGKVKLTKKIHKSALGKGSRIPWKMIPEELLEQMNELLRELDYPEIRQGWNETPAAAYLQARDEAEADEIRNVGEVFDTLFAERIKKESSKLKHIKTRCKFVISGEQRGGWLIDLTRPNAQITAGYQGEADCSISMTSGVLLDLANGKRNPMDAILQDLLQISGNVDVAYSLGQVLFDV